MRLAIVGSQERHWPPGTYDDVLEVIGAELDNVQPDEVVSGGADGVDTWAELLAAERLIPIRVVPPKGRSWEAFKERNIEIAETCDQMLCIRSKTASTYGSGWTADYAEKIGKPVRRYVL